jgi:hypothetical protein
MRAARALVLSNAEDLASLFIMFDFTESEEVNDLAIRRGLPAVEEAGEATGRRGVMVFDRPDVRDGALPSPDY